MIDEILFGIFLVVLAVMLHKLSKSFDASLGHDVKKKV